MKNLFVITIIFINTSLFANLLLDKNYMHKFQNFNPYRQLYFELNGWSKSNKLYYKVGIDNYFI